MSADGDALVRAILCDPHDTLARTAYADWLEEQGAPQHAALQRAIRREETDALLREISPATHTAFGTKDAGNPQKGSDGLLYVALRVKAFLARAFQGRAASCLRSHHITHLSLHGGIKDWAPVGVAPALAHLHGLGLGSTNLREDGAKLLARSPGMGRLSSLSLHRPLTDAGPGWRGLAALCASAVLPRLVHLDLTRAAATPAVWAALFDGPLAGQLRHLDLSYSNFNAAAAAALARAEKMLGGLVTLSVARTDMTDAGAAALFASPHTRNLRSLALQGYRLTDASLIALARSPIAPRLHWLGLDRGGALTRAGYAAVAEALSDTCRVSFPYSIRQYFDHETYGPLREVFGTRLVME